MIKYGDYEYPAALDFQMTTEKLNEYHTLGQGKLITLYVLANNTLSEIVGNLKRYLNTTQPSSLLQFGRMLRSIKRVRDLIS
jgi:hypothetical protein